VRARALHAKSLSVMPPLAIVRLVRATVMQQLRLEEALLRSTSRSWFVVGWDPRGGGPEQDEERAMARPPPLAPPSDGAVAAASSPSSSDDDHPTIVLGISGKPRELIDLPLCVQGGGGEGVAPPAAIRRFSGGGTVVVGRGTVLTSLIVSPEDLALRGVEAFPHPLMRWTAEVYARAFEDEEQAESDSEERQQKSGGASSSSATTTPQPPRLSLNENDYCFGDLKIAGNAQAITGGRALHHTSFLWDWKPEHMKLLLSPKRQPEYRRRRAHESFLGRVSSAAASAPHRFPLGAESLARALEESVRREWERLGDSVEEADPEELARALRGKHLRGNRWVNLRRELEEEKRESGENGAGRRGGAVG